MIRTQQRKLKLKKKLQNNQVEYKASSKRLYIYTFN